MAGDVGLTDILACVVVDLLNRGEVTPLDCLDAAATAGRGRSVTRKTATAPVDSSEARKLLKRKPATSTGQIVDGQISS